MISIAIAIVAFIIFFEILNVNTLKEIVFIALLAVGVGFVANLLYGFTKGFPTKRRRLKARALNPLFFLAISYTPQTHV